MNYSISKFLMCVSMQCPLHALFSVIFSQEPVRLLWRAPHVMYMWRETPTTESHNLVKSKLLCL